MLPTLLSRCELAKAIMGLGQGSPYQVIHQRSLELSRDVKHVRIDACQSS